MTTTTTQRAAPQARFAVWHTDGCWACPDCHGALANNGSEPAGTRFRVLWRCGGCGAEYGRLWGDQDAPERVGKGAGDDE